MKFATILAVATAACVVSASPLRKRQVSDNGNNDITIFNFALLLEHLEFEFYRQGLEKFGEADFRRANIPNPTQALLNFHHILAHEQKHVETLQTVITSLGGEPVPTCEFQFPMETVQDFTKLASVLEKAGVGAYNGAVGLLENPDLQTAAANIDTIEARHASFLQTVNGLDPFPADFDVALDGRQVVTLAAPVIKACPFELPFAPFGALQVDTSKVLMPGDECTVEFQRAGDQQHFCNFVFSDQSLVTELSDDNTCAIPDEARGDIFLMITSSPEGVTLKDTNAVVAGPTVMNVDTAHDDSCQRFVGKDEENTVDSFEVPVHEMKHDEMPPKDEHEPKLPAEDCAEEIPAEEAPVEEAPVEEAPVEEAPVEEAEDCAEPVEEAPVEDAPVEEAPVEEAPVEDIPAEDCAEEVPVDEHNMMKADKHAGGEIPAEIQGQIEEIEKLKEQDAMKDEEHKMKQEAYNAAPAEAAPEQIPEEVAPVEAAAPVEGIPPVEEVAPIDQAVELSALPGTDATTALVAADGPVLDMGALAATAPVTGETPQL